MQTILRLMTLTTMMLSGHVLTSCDGKVSPASSAGSGGASELAPGAPTAVAGTAGDSQVELTWSAPANNIETSITVYVVQYSSDNGTNWTTFSDGTSTLTSATVTGLTNGTSYVFRVAAKNSNGTGVYSASSPSVTPVTNPGVPTSVAGTAGNAEVSLTWSEPESNGGTAITDYVIQYSSNNGSTWTTFQRAASTAVSGKITGLTNGTAYVFKVAAKNSVGVGTYSEISSSLTPLTFPGVPTAVIATAGDAQVSLTWSAPASDGGALITDYEVQYKASSAGEGAWTTLQRVASDQRSATINGLTNGTAYLVRVAAKSAAGKGSYLESSSSVTPVTTPDAPTAVTATAGNENVSMNWNAPSNNGGSLITGYEVQYKAASAGDGSWETIQRSEANANITGLVNGTAYVFRVAAKNSVGAGGFTESITITPARAPDAPTEVAGIGGDAQVELSWTAPENTGGSSITEYSILYSSDGGENWSPAVLTGSTLASYTVTGLTIGTEYIFRVAARNSAGTGIYSGSSSSVMPPLWSEVTQNGQITMRDNRTRLWWHQFGANGGTETYQYNASEHCRNVPYNWQSDWRLPTAEELQTAYVNQISGYGRAGWFTLFNRFFWSETMTNEKYLVVNLATGFQAAQSSSYLTEKVCVRWSLETPESVKSVFGSSGDRQITLTWFAASPGASEITDYVIQYKAESASEESWVTFEDGESTNANATVTGLTNGTSYVFRVAAVNSHGTGNYRNSGKLTPATTPNAPTEVTGTAEPGGRVALSWTAPADTGGIAITAYDIQYSSNWTAGHVEFRAQSPATSAIVTGLIKDTAYSFRVAAINSAGKGNYSEISSAVTLGGWSDVTVEGKNTITMRDNDTGLWWSAALGDMKFQTAKSSCEALNYNEQNGWRLPTRLELENAWYNGIYSLGRSGWITIFNKPFWSGSSQYHYDNGYWWVVNLSMGSGVVLDQTNPMTVVCVRP